jgi:cytochrome c oxidase subunit 4
VAHHKPISPGTYGMVYVCLLGLTALTVYLASATKLGAWEVPVALGIASVKSILVGLIFMHLASSNRLTWLILGAGVLFLAVMILFTMADYWTRGWVPDPGVTPAAPKYYRP